MPDWKAELRARLRALRLPPVREADIVEELSQHLEDRYREARIGARSDADAVQVVLAELDGSDLVAELARVERPAPAPVAPLGAPRRARWGGQLLQDLRFGLRMLRTRPAFTLVAVLTLALGIGANTAIFSTVYGVLLRPLPFPHAERLVTFWGTAPERRLPVVNYPDAMVVYFQEHMRGFTALAAYSLGGAAVSGDGDPERVNATVVSTSFFTVLETKPVAGRAFVADDAVEGRNQVAVVSHALWLRRFGGDRTLVGRTIQIGGQPYQVVGIMPPGFDFPRQSEMWLPLVLNRNDLNNWYLETVARMTPGQTVEGAHQEVVDMSNAFFISRSEHPDTENPKARAVLLPLLDNLVGEARTPLLVLLGAVGCVLLIASANIGNLLLARALGRHREMALRCCLGASTRRIGAQLLTESLVLAVLGGGLGLLLAAGGLRVIRGLQGGLVPRLAEVTLNPVALAFTAGVTLLAGLLFGVAPALRAARVDLVGGLREGGRTGASAGARRLSHAFVVAQFALSLILLVGAGLLLRSFQRTLAVDPGFQPEHVLTARVQLPWPKYRSDTVVRAFHSRLLEEVRALPGIREAGLMTRIPFSPGNPQQNLYVEGHDQKMGPVINVRGATPGYFEAIGTPILKGRGFLPSDDDHAPPVVVVDETVAQQYWPGADPIGKRVRTEQDSTRPWLTVVGIARNVKNASLRERPDFELYFPMAQRPAWGVYVVMRTNVAPDGIVAGLRRIVKEADPALPVSDVRTMEDAMDASLSVSRLTNVLLTGFAALALLLAALGIYGVMSLSVSGRLQEFGVRLALGAAPGQVLQLVLRQGLVLAGIGLGLGLVGAFGLTRFLGSLLFEVSPADPVTYLLVGGVLAAAAGLACYIPARRATRADPIAVLRRD